MNQNTPTINPQLLASVLGWLVAQGVAFGLLDPGTAQTVVAVGGIILPAAVAIASALHLGRVHAAQIAPPPVPVVAVAPAPAIPPKA